MPAAYRSRSMLFRLFLVALCTGGASAAQGDGHRSERRYAFAGHGSLELSVPRDWRDELRQPPGGLPPTIVLGTTGLSVMLTPAWSPNGDAAFNRPAALRALVVGTAESVAPQAVEETLPLHDLSGAAGNGLYFSANDPAPKPGEYRYMIPGALAVRDLLVMFIILSDEKMSGGVVDMLSMLSYARRSID